MIQTLRRKKWLNSLCTVAVLVTVVIFSFVIFADEIPPVDGSEESKWDFDLVLEKLNIPNESMQNLLAGTYATVEEHYALVAAAAKLSKLNSREIRGLDPRFGDEVSEVELLDFLLEFGRNQLALMTPDQRRKLKQDHKLKQRDHIEEVTAYGFSFGHISEDPAEFSVSDISYMRHIRERANRLYREERYDVAYPLLLDLAKRGFRDAQSRLAYILFYGLGDVPKSNMRALGWLGAASAPPAEPGFRVLFKKYMRQVPEDVLPKVEAVVNGYREQFGHSEYQVCSTDHKWTLHFGSSIVKRTHCRLRLEAIADACWPHECWAHKVNTEPGKFMGLQPIEEKLEELLHMERIEELL